MATPINANDLDLSDKVVHINRVAKVAHLGEGERVDAPPPVGRKAKKAAVARS